MHGSASQQGMRRYLHARHQWHHRDVQALAQVVASHHGDHAGHRLRSTRMYGEYFGMRVWAAQECHVQHTRKLHVVHIMALAGDQHRVFNAPYRPADESTWCVLCCHGMPPSLVGECLCLAVLSHGLPYHLEMALRA
jgi:hypothetical protein